jgi:hypothetical protein
MREVLVGNITARITASGTVVTGKWLVDSSAVTATNAGTVKASPCRILYGLEQPLGKLDGG